MALLTKGPDRASDRKSTDESSTLLFLQLDELPIGGLESAKQEMNRDHF